jgi:hypothetical protein
LSDGESNRCAHQQGEAGTLPTARAGDTGDVPLDRKHQIKALAVGRKHSHLALAFLSSILITLSPLVYGSFRGFDEFLLFGFPLNFYFFRSNFFPAFA